MIDNDLKPWLIEVNTNPCIEESSNILKVYLPRMIEYMLKLTVDVVFPKKSIKKSKKKGTTSNAGSPQKHISTKL